MMPEEIKDTAALLKAWDDGEVVWTVEMGGMGPGYEQAIHVAAFEMLRYMLEHEPPWEKFSAEAALPEDQRPEWGKRAVDEYTDAMDKIILGDGSPAFDLGLSGAMHGAALNLAFNFCRQGYPAALSTVDKERHIQVSKSFP